MSIRVVNIRGLRTPEQRAGVVYVGRACYGWRVHQLANPFKFSEYSSNASNEEERDFARESAIADCLDRYHKYLMGQPDIDVVLAELWEETEHGTKPLGCWCVNAVHGDGQPTVCHAQILASELAKRFLPLSTENV